MNSTINANELNRRQFMEGTAKALLGVGALGMTNRAGAALGPGLELPPRIGAAKHILYL